MAYSNRRTSPNAPQGSQSQPESDERKLREARILDAAATLLVRWGYRKTTVDDVAREAGVGKGTIYLHWKDKNELFNAAIWRASGQASKEVQRRIAADPEGGRFHRLWTHGMLAILENPLLAALMQGKPDIFQGLLDTLDPALINQLMGNAEEHIAQLQRAGLIRSDLPMSSITFLIGALKMGIIQAATLANQNQMLSLQVPTTEQLAEALSDLMRRWLEPDHQPADSSVGKRIMGEWMASINTITEHES
jgi:AcrR family transcriptional regulator